MTWVAPESIVHPHAWPAREQPRAAKVRAVRRAAAIGACLAVLAGCGSNATTQPKAAVVDAATHHIEREKAGKAELRGWLSRHPGGVQLVYEAHETPPKGVGAAEWRLALKEAEARLRAKTSASTTAPTTPHLRVGSRPFILRTSRRRVKTSEKRYPASTLLRLRHEGTLRIVGSCNLEVVHCTIEWRGGRRERVHVMFPPKPPGA